MKYLYALLSLLIFTQLSIALRTITGIVYDDQGVPLPGATVLQEGTNNGTTTLASHSGFDFGTQNFTIEFFFPKIPILSISYEGMFTFRLTKNSKNPASINSTKILSVDKAAS